MYRKIASIRSEEDRREIIDELFDRFGEIPGIVMNLIEIALIKAMAEQLGIIRVRQEQKRIVFDFLSLDRMSPERIGKVSAEYGMSMLLHGGAKPFIRFHMRSGDRLGETKEFLTKLTQ